MLSFNILVLVAIGYVTFLFLVAFGADRRARQGRLGWLRSPLVYTLSLSIYTTAWTFYGAVGSAARSGLEFVTIYLGPTLVFVGWWWLLRKLVRIGQVQRITSIADMISSRYGKSATLAAESPRSWRMQHPSIPRPAPPPRALPPSPPAMRICFDPRSTGCGRRMPSWR